MKTTLTVISSFCGIVIASLFLTRLWINHPNMFPFFPTVIAERIAIFYNAKNAEDIADLEILVGMSISILLFSAITLLLYRLFFYTKSL